MLFNPTMLVGQRILVTGASSGIGRATSVLLSRCGAQLVLNGRNIERLEQTLAALEGSGHVLAPFEMDGSDTTADFLKALTADARPLSGVFHAAGVELVRAVKLTKAEHVGQVFGSSVLSALALARGLAMRGVMCDGGALVFMSSVAGQSGQTGMSAYSAAKAAVDGMVRSLAVEFAPRRIRVNSIAAGAVSTEMHERLTSATPSEALQAYEAKHLLGFGRPDDVAQVGAFLLSDAGRWVSGATWVVDGGYLVR